MVLRMRVTVTTELEDDDTFWESVTIDVPDQPKRMALVSALPEAQMEIAQKLGISATQMLGAVMARLLDVAEALEKRDKEED